MHLGDNFSPLDQNNQETIKGTQVFYTIKLPNGTISSMKSLSTAPSFINGFPVILETLHDDRFSDLREKDKGRSLSQAEATYRYWNTVHGIDLEEVFASIQAGVLSISPGMSRYFRAYCQPDR